MYIDKRLLEILETHRGETIDVNFMISLIKTIAEEHEAEKLILSSVENIFSAEDITEAFIDGKDYGMGNSDCKFNIENYR